MYELTKVRKQGNSPVVTISQEILDNQGIKVGDKIIVETHESEIHIRVAPEKLK